MKGGVVPALCRPAELGGRLLFADALPPGSNGGTNGGLRMAINRKHRHKFQNYKQYLQVCLKCGLVKNVPVGAVEL